jgi:hypothetical protein
MMEIKFRAWDELNKRMIEPSGVLLLPKREGGGQAMSGNGYNYVLMQFTGLKDKNGTEVFEGDLLKLADEIYQVIWHHNRWAIRNERGRLHEVGKDFNYFFEVIGNIYQNPKLLN